MLPIFLVLLTFTLCSGVTNCSSSLIVNDQVSILGTILGCLIATANSNLPPSYVQGSGPTIVHSDIVLNNLVEIDELSGSVKLDFYFRLNWTDPRLNMPHLWDSIGETLNPSIIEQGAEISSMLENNDHLYPWVPDIHFVGNI